VLNFDMGQTFDLTDEWAAHIGLPVRRSNGVPEEQRDQDA
jgi:hypothetical protein